MDWIIKISEEKNQRVRVEFDPLHESINFYGECRIKNNEWTIFSETKFNMKISLDELQLCIGIVVNTMRIRLIEYENLNIGFSVIKEVGYESQENNVPKQTNDISGELLEN